VSEDDVNRQLFEVEEAVAPLLDPLIQYVHGEHLLQAVIEDMFFNHVVSSPTVPAALGSVQTAVVFVDVASFTSLAETEGDEVAARILGRFDRLIRALALDHEGKLVKQLGDGFMLAFRRSVDAVHFAIALDDAVRQAGTGPESHRIPTNR
jgi:class 3 adenylate cyclase